MKKILVIGCLMLVTMVSFAQEVKPKYEFIELNHYADTLKRLGHEILYGSSDSIRTTSNIRFKELLHKALSTDNSFLFPFDSVKTVSILTAPDNSFRILTWNMPDMNKNNYAYFGFIQTYNKKKNTAKLFPLMDQYDTITNPQFRKLSPENWYGQVYYKMIPCKKGARKVYTLLGIRWLDKVKTQKIIDVVSVSGDKIVFGSPIFKLKKTSSRLLFSYSSQVVMSLKFDEIKNCITYDHLQANDPSLEGQYEFYGPDGSYDELIYKKGNWLLKSDIDARNPKDGTSVNPRTPMESINPR